jgi:hypothetical protein
MRNETSPLYQNRDSYLLPSLLLISPHFLHLQSPSTTPFSDVYCSPLVIRASLFHDLTKLRIYARTDEFLWTLMRELGTWAFDQDIDPAQHIQGGETPFNLTHASFFLKSEESDVEFRV